MRNLKIKGFLVFILLFSVKISFATHYRAGEITYEYVSYQTYRATINTYTEISGSGPLADQDSVYLNWGDGFVESVARTNGPMVGTVPNGEIIFGTIKKNIYVSAPHTYSGSSSNYIISVTELNRTANIINIASSTGSINVPFHLSDSLNNSLHNYYGINSSPVLLNDPIDYANKLDTFHHNPNAFDVDDDSLFFELIPSLQASNSPVPQYFFPNEIMPSADNNISINANTGHITWATPQQQGNYNIAFKLSEYRNGIFLGSMIRDMQILVADENNNPPQINEVNDFEVFAGDTINLSFQIQDSNLSDSVFVSASGSPFVLNPTQISFETDSGNLAHASLVWYTDCKDIKKEAHQINIKAKDNYVLIDGTSYPLVDIESFNIKVVPRVEETLEVNVVGDSINLAWTSNNICTDSLNFLHFSIWRKQGCDSLGNTDFKLIADEIENNSFVDYTFDSEAFQTYKVNAHYGKRNHGHVYNVLSTRTTNNSCIFSPKNYLNTKNLVENDITIYPNPNQGVFFIKSKVKVEEIRIYSSLGEYVTNFKNKDTIQLSNIETGFYFVKVSLVNGNEIVKRILIERN